MTHHPLKYRRGDVSAADFRRRRLERILAATPHLTRAQVAEAIGVRPNHLYDWLAHRRPFGPRLLRRLDRWCRPLLPAILPIPPRVRDD